MEKEMEGTLTNEMQAGVIYWVLETIAVLWS